MSKYSNEFKLKVVKYCIEEHHSINYVANKFNIPSTTLIYGWVKKYKEHGPAGLLKNERIQKKRVKIFRNKKHSNISKKHLFMIK